MRRPVALIVLVAFAVALGVGQARATQAEADVLARRLAAARAATARYALNLERAKADGYTIITPMIPNMGYHFLNPKIQGFDVTRPPILVYVRRGNTWQLVAVEWVFPAKPDRDPLPGARYGSFGAACHYKDGSFVMADAESACARVNLRTGAAFSFWHGPLVTLHVWLWYPNPDGVFAELHPYLTPFNGE
jgi:hypothetical protein